MADDGQDDSARRAKAARIDTTVPNAARVADYLNGGRNNFEADRKAAREIIASAPVIGIIPLAARAFRERVVRYLVAEAGVRQFLDVGTGLAASGNTYEIAHAIDPACRVVYVDSDPVVITHARALMRSATDEATGYVEADASDAHAILAGAARTLDFGQPVAILMMATATLAYIADTASAAAAVSALLGAVSSGSYVAFYHHASDLDPTLPAAMRRWNMRSPQQVTPRSRAEVASLVAGLDLVPPGIVPICQWRPADGDPSFEQIIPVYGLVARKPLADHENLFQGEENVVLSALKPFAIMSSRLYRFA